MKTFSITITDELGIHARPAGQLVKEAKKYASTITITKEGKEAGATKLMRLMGLGVKCGDTVDVRVEGEDEEEAAAAIEKFMKESFLAEQ